MTGISIMVKIIVSNRASAKKKSTDGHEFDSKFGPNKESALKRRTRARARACQLLLKMAMPKCGVNAQLSDGLFCWAHSSLLSSRRKQKASRESLLRVKQLKTTAAKTDLLHKGAPVNMESHIDEETKSWKTG
jgi:hypothetical protein